MKEIEFSNIGLTPYNVSPYAVNAEECKNQLTKALQADLGQILTAQTRKGNVTPVVSAALQDWIKTASIEKLSEWLGWADEPYENPVFHETGWKKVDIETLRKRTFAASLDERIYSGVLGYGEPPKSPTLPDGSDDPEVFGPHTVKFWMLMHEWAILESCLYKDQGKNWLAVLAMPWIAERAAVEDSRINRKIALWEFKFV